LQLLADGTNGRAYATVLLLSSPLSSYVCLSSVTLCIVAKPCVQEQKLLLRAYKKSYMRNRLVTKCMTLTFIRGRVKVLLTIALHSTMNISETVRGRGLVPKDHQ